MTRAACCRGIRYDDNDNYEGPSDNDVIDDGRRVKATQGDSIVRSTPVAPSASADVNAGQICTTPRRWFHYRPVDTSQQSAGLHQSTMDSQCDHADLITISRRDFREVIREAITERPATQPRQVRGSGDRNSHPAASCHVNRVFKYLSPAPTSPFQTR